MRHHQRLTDLFIMRSVIIVVGMDFMSIDFTTTTGRRGIILGMIRGRCSSSALVHRVGKQIFGTNDTLL